MGYASYNTVTITGILLRQRHGNTDGRGQPGKAPKVCFLVMMAPMNDSLNVSLNVSLNDSLNDHTAEGFASHRANSE